MARRNRNQRIVKRKLIVEMLEKRIVLDNNFLFWKEDPGSETGIALAKTISGPDNLLFSGFHDVSLKSGEFLEVEVVGSANRLNRINMDVELSSAGGIDQFNTGWWQHSSVVVYHARVYAHGALNSYSEGNARLSFQINMEPAPPLPDRFQSIDVSFYYKIKRSTGNLTSLMPTFLSNGDLKYGFAMEGSVSDLRIVNAYVTAEVFYATGPRQEDIIDINNPIASHNLIAPFERTVPAEVLRQKKPAHATHYVVIVDRIRKAFEKNESVEDNLKALRLPDLYVNPPEITSDLGLTYSYGVTNPHASYTAPDPFVALYYADVNGALIGELSGSKKEVRVQDGGLRTVSLPPTSLESLPDGTAKIIALIDGPETNLITETDESNNRAELVLPDEFLNAKLLISKPIVLRSDEGIDVPYEIAIGDLPRGKKAAIEVYWSETEGVPFGKPTAAKPLIVDLKNSNGTATFSAADLGRSWNGEKYLVARVRALGGIEASKYENNSRRLDVSKTPSTLSTDLEALILGLFPSTQPPAPAPARIRIAKWLSSADVFNAIKSAGDRFKVAPINIANAIVYEATRPKPTSDVLGGLQIDSYDVFAVESKARNAYGRVGYSGLADNQLANDRASFLAQTNSQTSKVYVQTAANYIAAIMNGYASLAAESKYRGSENPRKSQALLLSYFNNVVNGGNVSAAVFATIPSYSSKPIENVAVVLNPGLSGGTASLIAPGYAITAEHVMFDTSIDKLSFDPSSKLASSNAITIPITAMARYSKAITASDYTYAWADIPWTTPFGGRFDLRLVKLANPIGNIEPFNLGTTPAKGDMFDAYGFDTPTTKQFRQAPGIADIIYSNFIRSNDDAVIDPDHGWSGGPVLSSQGELVALVHGIDAPIRIISGLKDDLYSLIPNEYIVGLIGTDIATTSRRINLGDAKYYFEFMNKGGVGVYPRENSALPLTPNATIATWVNTNVDFLRSALKKTGTRALATKSGDLNDDEQVESDDRPAFLAAIADWDIHDDDEKTRLIAAGDLNKDGNLDDRDLALLDTLIADHDEALDGLAQPDSVTARQGAKTTISPLMNDVLPRGSSAAITSFTLPANGTLIRDPSSPSSRFQYTPNPGFSGIDTFSYLVTDRLGYASVATVSILPTRPATPSAIKVSEVKADSVKLEWKQNSNNESGFRIAISRDNQATWDNVAVTGPDVTSVVIPNLRPDTPYFFKMRAANAGGYSDYTAVTRVVRTLPLPPTAPTDFVVKNVLAFSAELSWKNTSSNVTKFVISKSSDNGATWSSAGSASSVSANASVTVAVSGLTPLTKYKFRLVAVNRGGNSPEVFTPEVTTVSEIPVAPSDLAVQYRWAENIQFTWKDNSVVETGYRLMGSSNGGATWRTWSFGRNVDRERADALTEATDYIFKVVAFNSYGSAESSTISVRTKLKAPIDFRVGDVNAYSIQVHWTPQSAAALGYRIYKSTDGGNTYGEPTTVAANATGRTLDNLQDRTTYVIKIVAFDNVSESDPLISAPVQTLKGRPAAPTNLVAQTIWPKTVQFAWNDNSDNEDKFKLMGSRDGGITWTTWLFDPNVDRGRAEDLLESTNYVFKLVASNHWGTTESNTVQLRTKLSAPTDLVVSDINAYSIQVRWTDTSSVESGFKIFKSTDGGNSYGAPEVTGANQTGWTLRDLQDQTNYVIKIIAFNATDESTPLISSPIRTLKGRPAAPTNLVAETIWPKTVQFAWNDNSDNETTFKLLGSANGGGTWASWDFLANENRGRAENLNELTDYIFKVQAINNWGVTESNTITVRTKLSAPTDLVVSDINAYSIQIRWTDTSSVESGFKIFKSTDGGNSYGAPEVTGVNQTGWTLRDLQDQTTYVIKVVAFNGSDESAALTSGAIRTLKGRPAAPSNLVAQTVWAKTVQFAWNDNSDNEAFFRLMGSSDGGATWSAWDFAAGETRGRAENLAESTDYIFKVVAFNSYGGAESGLVSVHTKIAAPTDLRIATLRSTSVDLNWNDNSSRESEFIVMLSTNGVDFFEVRREAANRLSTRISNLRANTRYWTKIVAVNSTDNAESNVLSFTTAR